MYNCATCIYAALSDSDSYLCQCKRYPPQLGAGVQLGKWPIVSLHDWCGEYVYHSGSRSKGDEAHFLRRP